MRLRAQVRHVTGGTRHFLAHIEGFDLVRDEEFPAPAFVEIEAVDGAFFLLYLDARGNCQTDGWHQTIEEAKAQAKYEFCIEEDDWVEVTGVPRVVRE